MSGALAHPRSLLCPGAGGNETQMKRDSPSYDMLLQSKRAMGLTFRPVASFAEHDVHSRTLQNINSADITQ
jgi:hypothetical protein